MNSNDEFAAVSRSLTAMRDSLGHARLDRPVETVFARAAARRRRRYLAAGTAALAVAGAGLAVSPAGTGGGPAGGARTVHVNLAAWSVNSSADGTVTLTVRQWRDPGALRAALRRAGVPAIISVGEFCRPATPSLQGITRVITGKIPANPGSGPLEWIIHPAAMPAGTELDFGYQGGGRANVVLALVRADSRLSCTSLRAGAGPRRHPAAVGQPGSAGRSPSAVPARPPAG